MLRRQPCGDGGTRDRRLFAPGRTSTRREGGGARVAAMRERIKDQPALQPLPLKKAAARAGVRTDQSRRAASVSFSCAASRRSPTSGASSLPRPQYLEARPGADAVPCRTRNRLSFATSETVQRTMAAKLPPLHQTGCANLLHPALRLACSGSNPISPDQADRLLKKVKPDALARASGFESVIRPRSTINTQESINGQGVR